MGKNLKKIDSKEDSDKPSGSHDFIDKKSKKLKHATDNNLKEKNKQKKYKVTKRKRRNLMRLIILNKRIRELKMKNKLLKILNELCKKKLDILNERYKYIILEKYNCLNENTIIR